MSLSQLADRFGIQLLGGSAGRVGGVLDRLLQFVPAQVAVDFDGFDVAGSTHRHVDRSAARTGTDRLMLHSLVELVELFRQLLQRSDHGCDVAKVSQSFEHDFTPVVWLRKDSARVPWSTRPGARR